MEKCSEIHGLPKNINSLVWTNDSKASFLVRSVELGQKVMVHDASFKVWDLEKEKEVSSVAISVSEKERDVLSNVASFWYGNFIEYAISPDAKHAIISFCNKFVKIVSLENGEVLQEFPVGCVDRNRAEWSPDETYVFLKDTNSLYDLVSKKVIYTVEGKVGICKWSPNGRLFAFALNGNGVVVLYPKSSEKMVTINKCLENDLKSFTWSPNSRTIFARLDNCESLWWCDLYKEKVVGEIVERIISPLCLPYEKCSNIQWCTGSRYILMNFESSVSLDDCCDVIIDLDKSDTVGVVQWDTGSCDEKAECKFCSSKYDRATYESYKSPSSCFSNRGGFMHSGGQCGAPYCFWRFIPSNYTQRKNSREIAEDSKYIVVAPGKYPTSPDIFEAGLPDMTGDFNQKILQLFVKSRSSNGPNYVPTVKDVMFMASEEDKSSKNSELSGAVFGDRSADYDASCEFKK